MENQKKAVFLDRDGTINQDPGYLNDPTLLTLLPNAAEGLKLLTSAGFELVIVTNQSGIGRGLVTELALEQIHDRMSELLLPYGVRIASYEYCSHVPSDECECRKPKPMLILDWAEANDTSLKSSVMVGDKVSDLLAGKNAGCGRLALVETGYGRESRERLDADATLSRPDFIGKDLLAVAQWIVENENS